MQIKKKKDYIKEKIKEIDHKLITVYDLTERKKLHLKKLELYAILKKYANS